MVKVQIVFYSSYLSYFDVSCSFLLKQKNLCFTTTPLVSCYLFLGSEGSMKCSHYICHSFARHLPCILIYRKLEVVLCRT